MFRSTALPAAIRTRLSIPLLWRRRAYTAWLAAIFAGGCLPLSIPSGGGGGGGGGGTAAAAATALVLIAFADSAQSAGCEPLLVGAWRDAALELDTASEPLPDSVHRLAAEEVGRAMARIRELCAQSTPRLDRLRQICAELAASPVAMPPTESRFAPVYFARGEHIPADSVLHRLRALGRRLADRPLPMVLRVEGFSEPDVEAPNLGLARANAVVAELRRGGLATACCEVVGGRAPAGEAALQRRVTFSIDYRETTP